MNFGFLDQATAAQTSGAAANPANNTWQMVLTIGIWVVVIAAAYFGDTFGKNNLVRLVCPSAVVVFMIEYIHTPKPT